VAGDHLDLVTDPTVPNSTTAHDAIDVLQELKLWNRVAPAIREHLLKIAELPVPTLADRDIFTVTIVNGKSARQAMQAVAVRHGLEPVWLGTTIEGIGHEVGVVLGDMSRTSYREGTPFSRRSLLLACGGEASVNVGDDEALFGLGGPCQELALGAAERLGPDDAVALVAIDTDGSDGSSRYAGALVDGLTEGRARGAGLSLTRASREHRSSDLLQELDDGLRTGLTGTNVNDMLAVVIA
jgi:glycerate-2-kinase